MFFVENVQIEYTSLSIYQVTNFYKGSWLIKFRMFNQTVIVFDGFSIKHFLQFFGSFIHRCQKCHIHITLTDSNVGEQKFILMTVHLEDFGLTTSFDFLDLELS